MTFRFKQLIFSSDAQKVLLLSLLFLLFGVTAVISRKVSTAYYITNFGAESLAYMYFFNSIFTVFAACFVIYSFARNPILQGALYVIGFTCALQLINVFLTSSYGIHYFSNKLTVPMVYANSIVGFELIEIVMWTIPAALFSLQQGKKIFAYLSGAFTLGAILAGIFLRVQADSFSTFGFLTICFVVIFLTPLIILYLNKNFLHSLDQSNESVTLGFSSFIQYLKENKYWSGIILLSALSFFMESSMEYIFNIVAENHNPTERELISFFGTYEYIASFVTMGAVLFVFNPVIQRVGIWNLMMIIPLCYALCFFFISITGKNIYVCTVFKIFSQSFFELIIVLFVFVYKAVDKEHRSTFMTFADYLSSISSLMFLAILGIGLTLDFINFSGFSLMLCALALGVFALAKGNENNYVNALLEGISDEGTLATHMETIPHAIKVHDITSLTLTESNNEISTQLGEFARYFLGILSNLEDSNEEVRLSSYNKLEKFIPVGNLLIPIIMRGLHDENNEVRLTALSLLVKLDPYIAQKNTKIVIDLIEMKEFKEITNDEIILVIKLIASLKLEEHFPKLIEYLNSQNEQIRLQSIHSLCEFTENQNVLGILWNYIGEKNEDVANALINGIIQFSKGTIKDFSELIFSEDLYVWRNILTLLMRLDIPKEFDTIISSTNLKFIRLYENLKTIQILKKNGENHVINTLVDELNMKNDLILNMICKVCTIDAKNEQFGISLYNSIKSKNIHLIGNAIEMVQAHKVPYVSQLLVEYMGGTDDNARLKNVSQKLFKRDFDYEYILNDLLNDPNEWIRACTVFAICSLDFDKDKFHDALVSMNSNEQSWLVKQNISHYFDNPKGQQTTKTEKDAKNHLMEKIIIFKNTTVLRNLDLSALMDMAELSEIIEIEEGNTIVTEGSLVDHIFFVFEGQVEVSLSIPIKKIIKLIKNEGVIGINTIYATPESLFEYKALSHTKAIKIALAEFMYFLMYKKEVSDGIVIELINEIDQLNSYIINKL